MSRVELRLVGSGGQGMILSSVILAEAAVLAGKHAAQSQAYGPEARGGACKAEVLISDEPIGFPKVTRPTLLLALTQAALDTYAAGLPEDCRVLMDDSLTPPASVDEERLIRLPILETARERVGKAITANIVGRSLRQRDPGAGLSQGAGTGGVSSRPQGTERLNRAALRAGAALCKLEEGGCGDENS